MYYSAILVAAAAFAGLANAQNSTASVADPNGYNPSVVGQVYASSVDSNTRISWCRAQTNTCPQLCGGQAYPNNCDSNTLNYTCTCTNGNSPNISDYSQTLPSLACQRWQADCVAAHPNDLDGINDCLAITCGNRTADSIDSSSSSGSASASAMASSSATGGSGGAGGAQASSTAGADSGSGSSGSSASQTASGASTSATESSAAVAINVAKTYGTGILATGMLALFGLAL